MMGKTLAALACCLVAMVANSNAAVVEFTNNVADGYVDIHYTVSAGGEFTNWDLIAAPSVGSILDPQPNTRSDNVTIGGIPLDTFANTVFSSVGAGPASYVFTEYNPGSAFPPVPAEPNPAAGAMAPNPDELNWTIFDTGVGDVNLPGFFPYHMARVMYSIGGSGVITANFFDTTNTGVGESFSFNYPEPAGMALAGMGLLGFVALRRKK